MFRVYLLCGRFVGYDGPNKVVREDSDLSVQLSFPPAFVLNLLRDDVDDLALLQGEFVVVDGVVGEQNNTLLFH